MLLSQCIFVCKEAILKETYIKLRKSVVEALMSLTQVHDKSDFSDAVLREQISTVIFIVLPKIATVLIKVCQEDTLRGPHLVKASLIALLYESAIEIKIKDIKLNDDSVKIAKLNLKMIRYNILCTCFVTELVGCVALQLGRKFQTYILRSMHKILQLSALQRPWDMRMFRN